MLSLFLEIIESPNGRTLFEYVYYEYRGLMLAMAMDILHDYQHSEDAVIEAFWRIARNFDRLLESLKSDTEKIELEKDDVICPQMKSYAVIVVRNVSRNMIQKNSKEVAIGDEEIMDTLNGCSVIEDEVTVQENLEDIINQINNLSTPIRDTMYLHYVGDFSIAEIAEMLDCSYDTIKKRLQRGTAKLRRCKNNEHE